MKKALFYLLLLSVTLLAVDACAAKNGPSKEPEENDSFPVSLGTESTVLTETGGCRT